MATRKNPIWLTEEVADFLASRPTPDEILAFRPSTEVQQRVNLLLGKSKSGSLSNEEQWELDQFEHLEMLMQMIKARLRPRKSARA